MCRLCIGYVSVMYRLCVGYVTEETRSEGREKTGKKMGLTTEWHGLARMGTETRDMIPPTPMARDLNYLNHKRGYLSTKKTINILALARRDLNYLNHKRGYLSTMKTIIFNNGDNENNKHPCAGAQKAKLSKPQAGIFINNENNDIQQ